MKIVIDIPEKWYRWAKFNNIDNGSMVSKGILDAVGNGTPLPKGHGDLIDRKELLKQPIDTANYPSNYVRIAPTIIEADKIESEDNG